VANATKQHEQQKNSTLLPFQILQVTITKIYHLFNILPISDYYLLLLNLSKYFKF